MEDALVTHKESDVLLVEVNSGGAFVHTVRKAVLLLFHYARLLKSFGVTSPQVHAFAFPHLNFNHCAVQVTMWYDGNQVVFFYSIKCIQLYFVRFASCNTGISLLLHQNTAVSSSYTTN